MSQKLYIGNLPYYITERDVRALMSRYEPVHSVILISDKSTGYPRGYGFVELDDPEADKAVRELHNLKYMGRNLRIGKAVGKNPREDAKAAGDGCLCRRCMVASNGESCRLMWQ